MYIDICHIYPITSGTAGTYMDGIYKALQGHFSQEVFVNYYYPFGYGKKWFYKYSDLSAPGIFLKRHNTLRRVIRLFEMMIGLIRTYIFIANNNVKIVNYSLNSDLQIEYLFLKRIKRRGVKVVITCHDVLPFGVSIRDISNTKRFSRKKKFFKIADSLIVHNNNSIEELDNFYGISGDKVIYSPFPIMDINIFDKENSLPHDIQNQITKEMFIVSMVGYFRAEKGLATLLEAWNIFYTADKHAKLIIAGHFPNKDDYDIIRGIAGVCVHKGFLDDYAYTELIKKSSVVVMPYLRGTNSGIPSSIVSMGSCVVSSDIEMFKNSPFISTDAMFETDNPKSLALKFNELYENKNGILKDIVEKSQNAYLKFKETFAEELVKSYELISK